MTSIFAQSDASDLAGQVLPWLGVLVVVAIIGGIIIMLLGRSLRSKASSSSEGFTLQSLREMHAEGKITTEEFEQAKQAMVGRVSAKAKAPETDASGAAPSPSDASEVNPADQKPSSEPDVDSSETAAPRPKPPDTANPDDRGENV